MVEETNVENREEIPVEEVIEKDDKGLSLRDALNVAVTAATHEEPTEEVKEEKPVVEEKKEEPALNAPAEWSEEEKQDFYSSSRKQQEASLRLHKSRNSKLEEIKEAAREYNHVKQLNESINPFIKAMGLKERPDVALQKAVQLWKEFEYAEDPRKAAAEYLKAKGVTPPKEWTEVKEANPLEDKIRTIQEKQDALLNRIAEEERRVVESNLINNWSSFEATKNANGTFKYPDLKSESGPQLAGQVGSLVNGVTPLSKQFIEVTQKRIPNLDYNRLLEEAYKYLGGKIDDTPARSQQSAKNHITKAKRAASSKPGGATMVPIDAGAKKLTHRAALEYALQEVRERNSD